MSVDLEEETGGSSDVEPASLLDPKALTLQYAIWHTLEHNQLVQQLRLVPRIQQTYVTGEEAEFDPVFSSAIDASQANQQVSSSIDALGTGLNSVSVTNFGGNRSQPDIMALQKKWQGGTITKISLGNQYANNNPGGSFLLINPSYTSNLGATITQPLWQGVGTDFNTLGIRISNMAKSKVELDTQREINQLLLQVEKLFWNCYATKLESLLVQEEIDGATRLAEQEKVSLQLGDGTIFKVTKSEDYLQQLKIDFSETELKHIQNLDQLANVMGNEAVDAIKALSIDAQPRDTLPIINADEIEASALSAREDVRAAHMQMGISRLRLNQSEEMLKPSINLVGRGGLSGLSD